MALKSHLYQHKRTANDKITRRLVQCHSERWTGLSIVTLRAKYGFIECKPATTLHELNQECLHRTARVPRVLSLKEMSLVCYHFKVFKCVLGSLYTRRKKKQVKKTNLIQQLMINITITKKQHVKHLIQCKILK